jgi:8-oxo-dGTP pyrophosphatase MutT (NUDIX family)
MQDGNKIRNIREYVEGMRRRLHLVDSVAMPKPGDKKSAAVLVPLIHHDGALEVLYTRRSDRLASHRGQVAFPGGRFDHRDENLLAAALRETHEEIGIPPEHIRVLGTFPGRRTNATDIAVTPFVGLIEGDPILTPDPKEVAEIFHVPLAALSDPRYRGSFRWKRPGQTRASEFPAILYGGQVIWGLTFSLTLTFLNHILDRPTRRRSSQPRLINSK